MIINESNLAHAFNGFKSVFNDAFAAGEAHWEKIAMVVPSTARDEAYGWLGQFPKLREWIGDEDMAKLKTDAPFYYRVVIPAGTRSVPSAVR